MGKNEPLSLFWSSRVGGGNFLVSVLIFVCNRTSSSVCEWSQVVLETKQALWISVILWVWFNSKFTHWKHESSVHLTIPKTNQNSYDRSTHGVLLQEGSEIVFIFPPF